MGGRPERGLWMMTRGSAKQRPIHPTSMIWASTPSFSILSRKAWRVSRAPAARPLVGPRPGRLGRAADAPQPIQGPLMILSYAPRLDCQLTLKGVQDKLPPHGMTGRAQPGNDA